MVTISEIDRMDCLYRHNALGRIIKLPIELLSQSAALFCPYRFHKLYGASGYVCAMALLFQQPQTSRLYHNLKSYAHTTYKNP